MLGRARRKAALFARRSKRFVLPRARLADIGCETAMLRRHRFISAICTTFAYNASASRGSRKSTQNNDSVREDYVHSRSAPQCSREGCKGRSGSPFRPFLFLGDGLTHAGYRLLGLCGHLLSRGSLPRPAAQSEEHTSELQSRQYLVCRLLLEK